ncbi:MAG: multidrug effflux MFS transporter [Rhodospirillales bacterium]|nr:multidrug effflux MFS transporter [Rhodospirillales bacterium]HJO97907.1 multidrug effflux MFS transporter [Rhodospirillales bacterium]
MRGAPPRPPGPGRPPFLVLIALTAAGALALNIFVPSIPGMQRVFDTDYATVQLTLTLSFATYAVMQIVYGPLSDRFGRRPVVLASLVVFLLGNVMCVMANSIETLIVGRVVQAVGGCAGFVVTRAILRDLYERERMGSMLGYLTTAMVTVPMVAPAVGGYLDVWYGWRAGFLLVAVFGAAVLAACLFVLHETNLRPQPGEGAVALASAFWRLLRHRAFCGYALQVGCTTGTFFAFVGGAPYVMVEVMGRPISEYGLYFMFIAAMYMAGNFISGRISARVGTDRMILRGTSLALAGVVILFLVTLAGALTPLTMFGAMAVTSLGNGFSTPNGLAGAVSVDPTRAGTASGVAGFLQMTVGALATYVLGLLLAKTAMPLAAVMLTTTGLAFAAHRIGVRPGPAV